MHVDWDYSPGGNVEHIAPTGLTPEEMDEILYDDGIPVEISRGKDRKPCKIGTTSTGRHIIVVFEFLNEDNPRVLRPKTAFDIEPYVPRKDGSRRGKKKKKT